jgi:hypothetical protein
MCCGCFIPVPEEGNVGRGPVSPPPPIIIFFPATCTPGGSFVPGGIMIFLPFTTANCGGCGPLPLPGTPLLTSGGGRVCGGTAPGDMARWGPGLGVPADVGDGRPALGEGPPPPFIAAAAAPAAGKADRTVADGLAGRLMPGGINIFLPIIPGGIFIGTPGGCCCGWEGEEKVEWGAGILPRIAAAGVGAALPRPSTCGGTPPLLLPPPIESAAPCPASRAAVPAAGGGGPLTRWTPGGSACGLMPPPPPPRGAMSRAPADGISRLLPRLTPPPRGTPPRNCASIPAPPPLPGLLAAIPGGGNRTGEGCGFI